MSDWTRAGTHLLQTLADSIAGFEHVAEHAHRFDFYYYSEHYTLQRTELVRKLRRAMKAHGLERPAHGTALASVHRLYLGLRNTLNPGVMTLVQELIRGETFLASRLDALLDYDGLPPDIYDIAHLIRANVSESLLSLETMYSHAGTGFAAGSFRLYK